MKLIRLLGITLILCFITNSCLEYQFTTRIYPDGSCERIMTVRGDSADLMHGIIPVPKDSLWKISIAHVAGDQKKFELTAIAHFPNVDYLNKYFYKSIDSMPAVSIKTELKKKFRWFYTYIDYSETYFAFTPYRKVAISKYLNENEVKILFAGDEKLVYQPNEDIIRLRRDSLDKVKLTHADSLKMEQKKEDIEKRYNEWLAESIFENVYEILAERAEKIKAKDINKDLVMAAKDSIFAALKRDNKFTMGDEVQKNDYFSQAILFEAKNHFPTEQLIKSQALDSLAYEEIGHRYDKMQSITSNTYANKLLMPGIITSTNAKSMNGNILSWEIEPGEFFFYDFIMSAESRIMNKWAFWTSGILVLLLLGGLIAGVIGKKKPIGD
jgi:hypothetical protein